MGTLRLEPIFISDILNVNRRAIRSGVVEGSLYFFCLSVCVSRVFQNSLLLDSYSVSGFVGRAERPIEVDFLVLTEYWDLFSACQLGAINRRYSPYDTYNLGIYSFRFWVCLNKDLLERSSWCCLQLQYDTDILLPSDIYSCYSYLKILVQSWITIINHCCWYLVLKKIKINKIVENLPACSLNYLLSYCWSPWIFKLTARWFIENDLYRFVHYVK